MVTSGIDIKEKRKFIDKELSQHRLYFDEDFKESRNNVWIPEAVDEMQKNNPYKGFQIEDFQNPGIPKKGNDNPEELNDILNNLRNRVGN